MQSEPCLLFGDGETSRDFCYVENVVQANLLAACANDSCGGRAYNVALGDQTTLLQLHEAIHRLVGRGSEKPQFLEFREGDVRHSKADITRAKEELGYEPTIQLAEGLRRTVESFT
jgi:UDP-N-acetylglucosamine 4-epimerase